MRAPPATSKRRKCACAGGRRTHPRVAGRRRRSRRGRRARRPARHRRRRARDAPRRGRARPGRRAAAAAAGRFARRRHPSGRGAGRDRREADVARRGGGAAGRRRRPRSGSKRCSSATPDRASSATMRRRGAMWRRRGCRRREERGAGRGEALARLRAGARPRRSPPRAARVAAVDAQIATLQKGVADADARRRRSPASSRRSWSIAGEMVAPRTAARRRSPISITPGPTSTSTSRSCRGSSSARRPRSSPTPGQRLDGTITFISPKAEFTPRNVQTAEERSKLVYRIKVTRRQQGRHPEAGHAGRSRAAPTAVTGMPIRFEHGRARRYGATDARSTACRSRSRAARCSALIGPDGAGKTTTIRLACGLLRPDARTRPRARPRSGRASTAPSRGAVGYLSQRFSLYGDLTHRREHRVLRRDSRRARLPRRRAIGCSTMTQLTPFRSGAPTGCRAA